MRHVIYRFPLSYFDDSRILSLTSAVWAMYFSDYIKFRHSKGHDVSNLIDATDKYLIYSEEAELQEVILTNLIETMKDEWFKFLNFFYNRQKVLVDLNLLPMFPKQLYTLLEENNLASEIMPAGALPQEECSNLAEANIKFIEKYNSKDKFLLFEEGYLDLYKR